MKRNTFAPITLSLFPLALLVAGIAVLPTIPLDSQSPNEYQRQGQFMLSGRGPVFIGRVESNRPLGIGNPSEYCLEDGYIWKGSPFRLGRVNLFGAGVNELRAGNMIVYGKHRASLDSVIKRERKCPADYKAPPMQLRSDWTSPECGFNIGHSTHARLKKIGYIEVSRSFPLEMIEILRPKGPSVIVKITNPFDTSIAGLKILAHYEGGRGKPKALYIKLKAAPAPGKSVELAVDTRIDGDRASASAAGTHGQQQSTGPQQKKSPRHGRRGTYKLRSIDIRGEIGQADFDLSHPVR